MRNREALYGMSQALEKAAKKREASTQPQVPGQAHGKVWNPEVVRPTEEDFPTAVPREELDAATKKQKKNKKRKAEAAEDGAAEVPRGPAPRPTAVTQPADAADSGHPTPTLSSIVKPKKKKRRVVDDVAATLRGPGTTLAGSSHAQAAMPATARVAAADAAGPGDVTPVGSPSAAPRAAHKSQPKSVRFGLKRNLINYIGEPPKPEEVRTPPTCKPKGSALKRSSLRNGAGAGAPTASKGVNTESGRKSRVKRNLLASDGRISEAANGVAKKRSPVGTRSTIKSRGAVAVAAASKDNGVKLMKTSLPSPRSLPRPKAADFF
jgi:hypothetical protein